MIFFIQDDFVDEGSEEVIDLDEEDTLHDQGKTTAVKENKRHTALRGIFFIQKTFFNCTLFMKMILLMGARSLRTSVMRKLFSQKSGRWTF